MFEASGAIVDCNKMPSSASVLHSIGEGTVTISAGGVWNDDAWCPCDDECTRCDTTGQDRCEIEGVPCPECKGECDPDGCNPCSGCGCGCKDGNCVPCCGPCGDGCPSGCDCVDGECVPGCGTEPPCCPHCCLPVNLFNVCEPPSDNKCRQTPECDCQIEFFGILGPWRIDVDPPTQDCVDPIQNYAAWAASLIWDRCRCKFIATLSSCTSYRMSLLDPDENCKPPAGPVDWDCSIDFGIEKCEEPQAIIVHL